MTDEEMDLRHDRREILCKKLCEVMGWEYKTGHLFGQIRAIGLGKAIGIGLEKIEEIIKKIESREI